MPTLIYAGIGARATPPKVLADMRVMSQWLARQGWHLATGGADGADGAFAGGTSEDQRTLWLPWAEYNGHRGAECRVPSLEAMARCMDVAGRLHPSWERCSPGARKLHARNVAILLGETLDRPVDACVAWSSDGRVEGGTGMGIRIAREHGIPVFNLGSMTPRAVCERLQDIRQDAMALTRRIDPEDSSCEPC